MRLFKLDGPLADALLQLGVRPLHRLEQARIVDSDGGLGGQARDQVLGAFAEHVRLRMAEEQAPDHLARARRDRHRKVAAHGQVALRHARMRSGAAVPLVLEDVVRPDHALALEGRREHRGRARHAEPLERRPLGPGEGKSM